MAALIEDSAYFGVTISLLSYGIGWLLNKKTGMAVCNPLLISIVLTISALAVMRTDYATYYSGAQYLSWLLTPATVCLAVPLYEKLALLKSDWRAITAGIVSGVLSSLLCVFLLSMAFGLGHADYVTFLPKSVTTAIGIGISEELGGNVNLTAAVIIITGVLGNILAPLICGIFRITEPVAKGIAIGTAAHAVGTAKAMEMGETEGAMSSLSIAVSGILTVVGASVFAQFY
ncbi:MAG: LrgB family protein [Roseburia sp.]|nr:LrgB family protein [Roseburia sp.]